MDNQPGLFDVYPNAPGYRREGTSRLAADAVKPRAASLRDKVLALLKRDAMTADEAAACLNVTVLACRPRFSELLRMGLIYATGRTRPNASGKEAVVWRAWG